MSASLSRSQVREIDQVAATEFGLSGLVLMENAGRSCADWIVALRLAPPFAILCGKGNNGGDGFVIARHLEARGHAVKVLLLHPADQLAADAAVNFQVLQHAGTPLEILSPRAESSLPASLTHFSTIVDAIFGTGFRGTPTGISRTAIDAINSTAKPVVAVDLPSGLDCDTGLPSTPCVRANHTITFVDRKLGFDQPSSVPWAGSLHIADIGIPKALRQRYGLGPACPIP